MVMISKWNIILKLDRSSKKLGFNIKQLKNFVNTPDSQEHNIYKFFFVVYFNSKELRILLQFVDLACSSYVLIFANFPPSDCRLTAIFMGKIAKWLILYQRSIM